MTDGRRMRNYEKASYRRRRIACTYVWPHSVRRPCVNNIPSNSGCRVTAGALFTKSLTHRACVHHTYYTRHCSLGLIIIQTRRRGGRGSSSEIQWGNGRPQCAQWLEGPTCFLMSSSIGQPLRPTRQEAGGPAASRVTPTRTSPGHPGRPSGSTQCRG